MFTIRSTRPSSNLFNIVGLLVLVFSTFAADNTGAARAHGGIQLMAENGSSFYYYADGDRIPLAPSLEWMSVKFASDDPSKRSIALNNSIAGSLDQARQIPNPELTLLPLRKGLTIQALVQDINSLRTNTRVFLQVNPVFQTYDAEMAITDEFIATFPLERNMEEINAINTSYGVELVE
ncbi:MAG: hypothetical protein ABIU06_07910, partial [Anaerolineales bacterium]